MLIENSIYTIFCIWSVLVRKISELYLICMSVHWRYFMQWGNKSISSHFCKYIFFQIFALQFCKCTCFLHYKILQYLNKCRKKIVFNIQTQKISYEDLLETFKAVFKVFGGSAGKNINLKLVIISKYMDKI